MMQKYIIIMIIKLKEVLEIKTNFDYKRIKHFTQIYHL